MSEAKTVGKVHIIEGRPWKDAIIKILEPRSAVRPWHVEQGTYWRGEPDLDPGDAVVVVLDTDPQSVLAAVGILGSDGDVYGAIAGIDPFYLSGLMELGTLNTAGKVWIDPRRETTNSHSADKIVAAVGGYHSWPAGSMFGHTSLAAGRVLLNSRGWCTGCRHPLYLAGPKASDHIHIHTADPPPVYTALSQATDWPAALCDTCHRRMTREGFTSFLDYRFTFHPPCRRCTAQRTEAAQYGMPMGPIEEPWIAGMGCAVWGRRKKWVCGECGHQW